jgi:branched-chain amino acid transport system substrate-binding protein
MRVFAFWMFLFLTTFIFAQEPLRVGVILPLTGFNDFLGERCRKAIQMSLEDLPKEKRERLKLFWEDDRAVLKDSVLAANRLCDLEKVDVLVSWGAGTLRVIAPVAKRHDIIHINASVARNFADGQNNFSFWGRPENGAKLVVNKLKAEGKKRISVLYAETDPSIRHTKAFTEEANKQGLEVIEEQKFIPGERDFRITLLRLDEKKPDAMFVFAWLPEIEIILRQMKQTGIKTPITSIEGLNFVQDRSLIEGVWYATGTSPTAEFQTRYEEKYKIGGDFCESEFYDIIQLLAEIKDQFPNKKPSRTEIAEALKKIKDRPSASGQITVDPSGEILVTSQVITIKEGKAIRSSD